MIHVYMTCIDTDAVYDLYLYTLVVNGGAKNRPYRERRFCAPVQVAPSMRSWKSWFEARFALDLALSSLNFLNRSFI